MPVHKKISEPLLAPAKSRMNKPDMLTIKHTHFWMGIVPIAILIFVFGLKLGIHNGKTSNVVMASSITPAAIASGDIPALLAQVSHHLAVNMSEQPTVATVNDPEMLRSQNPGFYKEAQAGDRLIVWTDKAVLYSVKKDLVLAVLPLSSVAAQVSQPHLVQDDPATLIQKEGATIEVRNGTHTKGLGNLVSSQLKKVGLSITAVGDAKKKPYAKTVIVKVNDKALPASLQVIQHTLDAQVVDMPPVEGLVNADFLVIVGDDFQPST